jgi:hypothetical protein
VDDLQLDHERVNIRSPSILMGAVGLGVCRSSREAQAAGDVGGRNEERPLLEPQREYHIMRKE